MNLPVKGSWIWKRILQARTVPKALLSWKVGDGSRISFWFDRWDDYSMLLDLFSESTIIQFRIPLNATVTEVFGSSSWINYEHGQLEDGVRVAKPLGRGGFGRWASPRVSLFMWLLAKGRLRTYSLWFGKGLMSPALCILCSSSDETPDHLLFSCPYAEQAWYSLQCLMNITALPTTWDYSNNLFQVIIGAYVFWVVYG
ncbi:hypothetical protein MLD38_011780 [Melastoma candidum]|uniref:Uncharacterized protein n=1 Tax=Melastoma candidum TaxID=119954 RepID=A0ACB9R492_9MYRT|nr:hypothetical protein MLD38_011780 [Melastoma candidum]